MRTQIGLGLVLLLTAACSQSNFVGEDAGGDGGVNPVNGGGEAGTDAVAPPNCDATKLPSEATCVIDDYYGVFVSSSLGTAVGDGTKAKPFVSLDAAIAAAKKSNKRVYACAETYPEQIHLASGVDVFGYLDCNGGVWTAGTKHAKVASPASPAATASNITTPTLVDSVDIFAPDFTDKSQSSIALIANASPALKIKNATIHAGKGGKGDDGASGVGLVDSGAAKNGGPALMSHVCGGIICPVNYGGAGGANTCSGATGHDPGAGGNGGMGGNFQSKFNGMNFEWDIVTASAPGLPTTATAQTASGGAVAYAGNAGAPGVAGSNGVPGTSTPSFSTNGFKASDGTAGTDGAPGQGGGGAGAASWIYSTDFNPGTYAGKYGWGESGAGGGAGGCPGLASMPGLGGGASVAIIAIQSPFTLDTVNVESSNGGDGGSAGIPSDAQSGGTGGTTTSGTLAAGAGGRGGAAGVSGNGAGGPSIGIAFTGGSLQRSATNVTFGAGGNGVALRALIQGGTIAASPAGISQMVYTF